MPPMSIGILRLASAFCLLLHIGVPVVLNAQEIEETEAAVSLSKSSATESGPFFFHDLPYGSDAFMGPLDVILNKGFALSQTEAKSRKVFEYPYGASHVYQSLIHPLDAIERGGGWWPFLQKEVLPLSFSFTDSKWYTNYTGHVIEGGIHWRRLKEWYEARDVPAAGLMSTATSMAAAFLNEMYEHPGIKQGGAATVADLYFFDVLGIVLFSSDGVSRFFAQTLHANIWPGQASLTFPSGEIHNNANYLFFKFPWGVIPNSSIFFWTGIGAQIGLTFHRAGNLDVSLGVGKDAKQMHVDPSTGEETADLAYSAGLFVDRNNSLLVSVRVGQLWDRLLNVNVYPGVFRPFGGSFGAWVSLSRDFQVRLGVTNRYWLGAGIGLAK